MDQKKYRNVGRNFKHSLMIGVALTVGAMTFAPSQAHAQSVGDGVKEEVVTEVNKTLKSWLGGAFKSARERMEHDRNERDATYKTGTTANQSAQREAIINGSGANGGGGNGGMITTRTISVDTRSGSGNRSPSHTVNSSIRSDNKTQAQIEAQRQRDQYNMERQIVQTQVQQEIQSIRNGPNEQLALLQAQNEALRLQLEAMKLQQEQQNNSGSSYYQPGNNGAGTQTLSQRDQQMLQNCEHMKDNGATVLPDSCNNLLNSTFQITTRR
ncbi:MAG: hypothetical protein HND56_03185 [Pseudomonadota bacterium]|jgi:hypothetical protein|nr:hypothetical protein [Pseudomonadota bacterium]QKK04750.1 MAG: hypothetical protein HND56_03185 [Pseudomonadota bacterium]